MANLQPLQESFQAGEISPRLRGRVQSERYSTGLEVCENFLPRSQGPLELRSGLEHVAEFTGAEGLLDARLVPLKVSDSVRYVIAIAGFDVKVYDQNGPVIGGLAGVNLIFNGEFDQALLGWSTEVAGPDSEVTWRQSSTDVLLRVGSQLLNEAKLGQSVEVAATGDYVVSLSGLRLDGALQLVVKVGTALGDDTYGAISIDPVDSRTPVGPFDITATGTAWLTFELIGTGEAASWAVDTVSMSWLDPAAQPVEFQSPWEGFALWNLSFEQHPTQALVLFAHPNVAPQELRLSPNNVWSLQPSTFTSPPASWAGLNWPGALTFGEGRLWYGGTPDESNRFWGSKSDDYFDFTQGTNADDALEFTLAKRGRIVWMAGAKNLVIGTKEREFIVTGGAGVISPGNIDATPQSAYGSFAGQRIDIGERILYVSGAERKLRSMGYEWQADAWISVDLVWPSEHITEGRIQDVVFQSDPVQILWMHNRADGGLLACAYDREQKVVGWARCPTPGRVLALAATDFFGISEIWAIVQYDIGGVMRNYIERLDPLEQAYMDSHIHRVLDATGDVVAGLDHLEGRTVKVLVNDAAHPDRIVSGGEITLQTPTPYAKVLVGLGYRGWVRTLPLEGGAPKGTQQGRKKRFSRIFVRLQSSSLPHINGKLPPDRTPDAPMDSRQPPWTEDVEVRNFGWDRTAQVELVQDVPLATTIVGIFGEVQANG